MSSTVSGMKAAVPIYKLAPLEYRVALDVVSVWLVPHSPLLLCCEQPALLPEIGQRLSFTFQPPWQSGLWLEPQRSGWQETLVEFSKSLPAGARLAVLLSLPLARILPERRSWSGCALGEQLNGLPKFRFALTQEGFGIEALQGLHSSQAILGNIAGQVARKLGMLALGDRLEFTARINYTKPISRVWLATCALVLAVRQ